MSAAELSRQLKVPTNRVTEILNGQRAITADTALRFAHSFGTSAQFWLNLQNLYELRRAEVPGMAVSNRPEPTHAHATRVCTVGSTRVHVVCRATRSS
jgi:addiction module HigA family antidote